MTVLTFIGAIISMIGVILVYDARPITKKVFGFGDQNDGAMGLKIVGLIFSIVGGIMII